MEGICALLQQSSSKFVFLLLVSVSHTQASRRSLQSTSDDDNTDDDDNKKKYVLWLILGGLVLFLILAAFIIETFLSKSKRDEVEHNQLVRQQEEIPEKTQIESRVLDDSQTPGNKDNMIRQPLMEQNSQG